MPDLATGRDPRLAALVRGVAQWRDRDSKVRRAAREAFEGGEWPPQVVEAALDNALHQADDVLAHARPGNGAASQSRAARVLAILPGNVVGPTIAAAYCAAAADATLLLKSSSRELRLAEIVTSQFAQLDAELAKTMTPMRWSGGDEDFEAKIFASVERIVAFGSDETVADIKRRAPPGVSVEGYGSAYSIGYVPAIASEAAGAAAAGSAAVAGSAHEAANSAAADVALFDQRGCLSPQTIYVEGDESKAILFAHALRAALDRLAATLPRARAGEAEKAAAAEFVRRLPVRALPPVTHALDTILIGPDAGGVPGYVVAVETFGEPVCAGFGRIVIVKPARGAQDVAQAVGRFPGRIDSIGIAGRDRSVEAAFTGCGATRICALGEMQRPPFGYRPRIADFRRVDTA